MAVYPQLCRLVRLLLLAFCDRYGKEYFGVQYLFKRCMICSSYKSIN